MRRPVCMPLYSALLVLALASILFAGEGVDVSFSVRAIQISDLMKSRLSHTARWAVKAENLNGGLSVVDVALYGGGSYPDA